MKCLVLLVLMINLVLAKQYERCQLAEELYYKHNVTLKEIGMLVCFAETRSNLDTESLDNGNYGLLKFNSRAWCSITDEVGGNCNVKCDDFIDDDITDDIKCAKQIILAEGLDAWGLTTECQETSERIIEECFNTINTTIAPEIFARKYKRCELAKELYEKYDVKLENVGMLVCFAEKTSNLETGKASYGSYGLFQLNGNYWCSNDYDTVNGCDKKCSDLIDDDITDDVKCVKRIISAEGLDAWGLTHRCSPISIFAKRYERCELARELSQKHNFALEDVGMLVCIAEEGSNLDTDKTNSIAYGLFQLHNKFWCLQNEVGGGCIMKCSDLIDDDITDDVKCVKRILLVEGFDAWGKKTSCVPTSKAVIKQCFSNELNSSENESHNGTLIVEFVDLMIESIKSFGTGSKLNSNNHPIINNYFVFNINGNQVKKIKLVSDKTQQQSTQSP
ncbi:unnamed protein product [Diamesa hyperborea]